MGFNIFNRQINTLKATREKYVKEFKVEDEIKMTPCSKFVACLEKLTKTYVLALTDTAEVESLQVASASDIEFYEGYELAPAYTDSVRKSAIKHVENAYFLTVRLVAVIDKLETKVNSQTKAELNEIKLNLRVISDVLVNIFKHITMTDDIPQMSLNEALPDSVAELKNYVEELMQKIVHELNNANGYLIIEYINRQIDLILSKLNEYYIVLDNLM